MSIRYEIVGTGLTKRIQPILMVESVTPEPTSDDCPTLIKLTIQEPSSSEETHAIQSVLKDAAASSTFDGFVEPWEARARELLARVGFPPLGRMVRIDANGRWTDDLPEDWFSRAHEILRPGEGIGDAITVAQRRYGIDSPEWFAATILQATNRVREVIARGETARGETASAAHLALQLGIEMAIAWFKLTWESDTLTGQKIHAAVSHGGRQRARAQREAVQQRHADWQHAAENLWHKNLALSISAVARIVGKQFGVSPHTVRPVIHKPAC
jgi:hypothetical protein